MSDQDDALDSEMLEQGVRIRGELLEAVLVALRFGGLAESDLVGRHHPIAGLTEHANGGFPRSRAEVLSVQQHDCPAIGPLRTDSFARSEERRVGKGCRSRWWAEQV